MILKSLIVATIAILIGASFSQFTEFDPYGELERIDVGDSKSIKVGILGDSQLNGYISETNPMYKEHLEQSFNVLKDNNIEVLLHVGDIGNNGTEYAFQTFMDVFEKVFKDNKPILNIIMGNHDYYAEPYIPSVLQERFFNVTGEKPMGHKVFNGYHFVNWGSASGVKETVNSNIEWARKEIEMAIEEDQNKPVFVITHLAPIGTMYGSDDWGLEEITQVLKDYPQVISFSGHSHFSLIDERSIWQGEFTSIQTQAVAYIELEYGKENGSIPTDQFGSRLYAKQNYMGLIMNVNEKSVEIQRISFQKKRFYKEPWIIDTPIKPSEFRYRTESRKQKAVAPRFDGDNSIQVIQAIVNDQSIFQIKFKQAIHEDFVHSYRIVFSNKDETREYLYFSDFFLMEEDRKEYITLKLPELNIGNSYHVKIYAIESFGKISNPIEGDITIKLSIITLLTK